MISCRVLNEEDFSQLHQTLLEAFSDYSIPIKPDAESLRRQYRKEGIKYEISVGAFDADRMVGFTVNAVGDWQGKPTAYDGGTGVIPAYRRRGISRQMFDFILPILREHQIEQYLLEVIAENTPALELYKNLGFQIVRELVCYRRAEIFSCENRRNDAFVEEIENPDWNQLQNFWTSQPGWQNSVDSLRRSFAEHEKRLKISGLFREGELIGYATIFHNSGSIGQIAVAEKFRRRGFGKLILHQLQLLTDKPLFIFNVDGDAREFSAFLTANGFELLTTQYEMQLKL